MVKTSLDKGNVKYLFIRMVIPAVISQLVTMAYNVVDRIYIGHLEDVGRIALTGVGICMPITVILSAFAQLVGFGGAPRASAKLGERKKEEAEQILGTCTLFLIFLGIVLTILTWIFSDQILMGFGASEETFPFSLDYFKIYV